MKKIILKITFILLFFNPVYSADQSIDMLNKSGKEINVYSKKVVNIDVEPLDVYFANGILVHNKGTNSDPDA